MCSVIDVKMCRIGIEQGGHVSIAAPSNLVTQAALGSAGVWEHWAGVLTETSSGRAHSGFLACRFTLGKN